MDSPTPFPDAGSTELPLSSTDDALNWNGNWNFDDYFNWENISSSLAHDSTMISRVMDTVSMAMYSFALLAGTTGNGLVIFLTAFRMKKTVTTIWYLNLALADFIFSICLLPEIMYKALGGHWPLGKLMCKLDTVVPFLNMFASVFFLTAISADRYVVMAHPVWGLNHRSVRLTSVTASLIWSVALFLSSPYFHFRDTVRRPDGTVRCAYEEDGDPHLGWRRSMVLAEFVIGFLIPFAVILACYGALLVKLRRKLSGRFNRSLKVIVTVVVAFFVCWFPFHVFAILETLEDDGRELETLRAIGSPMANVLVCLNSCLNPFLYAFVSPGYRKMTWRSLLTSFKGALDEKWATLSSSSTKNSSFTLGVESSKTS